MQFFYSEKDWKQFKPAYMEKQRQVMEADAKTSGEEAETLSEEDLLSNVHDLVEIPKLVNILKKFEDVFP